jgi:hypothetical protein
MREEQPKEDGATTTTNPQPHPLRCETCKNEDCQITVISADTGCDVSFNPRDPIEKTLWFVQGIEQVGCASHSSAKSDKMDELWEFCKLNGVVVRDDLVGFPGEGGFLLLKILKKITELRTKER